MNKIKKMNSDEVYEFHRQITDELLKKKQKEYDDSKYPCDRGPNDKLKCQICGGRYLRSSRSAHHKTEKHRKKIREIHQTIHDVIYD